MNEIGQQIAICTRTVMYIVKVWSSTCREFNLDQIGYGG